MILILVLDIEGLVVCGGVLLCWLELLCSEVTDGSLRGSDSSVWPESRLECSLVDLVGESSLLILLASLP